ncbi:MAG: hypothetical protein ABR589_09405 [Chthoniobacterales bacterium]
MIRGFAILLCAAGFFVSATMMQPQTSTPPPADEAKYGVYPIAYREIIMRWLETQLLDAASAKVEWLGEPKPVVITGRDGQPFAGYAVDFKVNSRNKFGMYTGFQARRVYIRNGEVAGGGRKGS